MKLINVNLEMEITKKRSMHCLIALRLFNTKLLRLV